MATNDEPLEVSASDLRNAWHKFLQRVSQARQEIVVTRYGQPIAKLSPYEGPGDGGRIFGRMAGSVTVHGDIIAPVDESWDADA